MTLAEIEATALWHVEPGRSELRSELLPPLQDGWCRLRMLVSAVSRGTEALVFHGLVPESEGQRMRAPHQAGDFSFPVKYGYQAVAHVEAGPADLKDRTVFALHPHQNIFDLPAEAVIPLPAGLPPARAALAANMETALNVLWDSGAKAGDLIAVIGAGTVGLLVAHLAAGMPGADVTLIDIDANKAAVAQKLGLTFALPPAAPRDCDCVIHLSGNPGGLVTALDLAGEEARIVEASWYGTRTTTLPLGKAFHARRLALVSSQVGRLPPERAPRWTHRRRLEKALDLLGDERLDALLEPPIAFSDLPAALPLILGEGDGALAQLISYGRD